jgi:hypothetical protein
VKKVVKSVTHPAPKIQDDEDEDDEDDEDDEEDVKVVHISILQSSVVTAYVVSIITLLQRF